MTALYKFGAYSSPIGVLNEVDSFLVDTLGWTRNMGPTAVAGKSGRRAHYQKTITKGSCTRTLYWNFWASGASEVQGSVSGETSPKANGVGLYAYGATGFDGAKAWDRQPGYPVSAKDGGGLFSYAVLQLSTAGDTRFFLFGDSAGDAYFLFEGAANSGICAAVYAGILDKEISGEYEGGEFYGGSVIYKSQVIQNGYIETPTRCAWELPFANGAPGYYNSYMFVRANVDGVLGWVTIQLRHSTTDNLETKTNLLGFGNCLQGNTIYAWTGATPSVKSVPHVVNDYHCSVSQITGVMLPRDLLVMVWRPSISKPSVLGSVPIVKYCDCEGAGLPFGMVLQGKFLSRFMMIEMNDV